MCRQHLHVLLNKKQVSNTLTAMGIPSERADSAIRLSLSYYNTMEEVKKCS